MGKKSYLRVHIMAVIDLTWKTEKLQDFFPLLHRGVWLKAKLGLSIRSVLCDQLGVAHEYLDKRIGTIFLDGSPVDDVDSAIVHEGARLALSAAMPGLVGATMRKGGILASMRDSITHRGGDAGIVPKEGVFLLRLFNMVAPELGPALLKSGVQLEAEALRGFFESASDELWTGCQECLVDGKEADCTELKDIPRSPDAGLILFRVESC